MRDTSFNNKFVKSGNTWDTGEDSSIMLLEILIDVKSGRYDLKM